MKKQTIGVIALVTVLLLTLASIEWLKAKDQRTVYGMTLSFANEQQRSFTWLTVKSYENSILQIKPADEDWQQSAVMELAVEQTSAANEQNEVIYTYRSSVEELEAEQRYTYRVMAGGKPISDEYSFTVAASQAESFQFIHVTDTQGVTAADYEQWGKTLQQALRFAPAAQFIVHGGDLTDDPGKEQEWKWFFNEAPALTAIPFFATTGNHELIDGDISFYQAHFTFPDNGAEVLPQQTTYYTTYQNLLFISLNTEGDIDEQTVWLQDVLEQQAASHDWIVVSMHRGVYGASRFEEAEEWTELFDHYGVALVLQGHNHSYSRSYPLKKGKAVAEGEQGTVYVTLNAAGSKLNEEKKAKAYQAVAFQNGKSMFAIVDVSRSELLYSAYDADGKLLDQFTLVK